MNEKKIPLHVVFVEAWIKKGDQILLAKRSSKDDNAAGTWAVPGGKVEAQPQADIIEDSLGREVMEEVGVLVTNPRYVQSGSFHRSSGHHVVKLSFLVDYVSGEAKPLEDQDAVKWVDINQAKEMVELYHKPILDKLTRFFQSGSI